MQHKPVLLNEALGCLDIKPGAIVMDGTIGSGGHAREILQRVGPGGKLIGLDRDEKALERCRKLFEGDTRVMLYHENYRNVGKVLDLLNIPQVDAVILDVGFSSDQLEDPSRGFSFESTGPLDMRMDQASGLRASDLVNELPAEGLKKIFWEYGNERFGGRYAESIVRERKLHPIETTADLTAIILKSIPGYKSGKSKPSRPGWARRHPATKVFQALRIAVNDELGALEEGLPAAWGRLKPGGRLAVISFHSLEDRIAKRFFKGLVYAKQAQAITKKPVTAEREEIVSNPRSRSAKLRAAEKIK